MKHSPGNWEPEFVGHGGPGDNPVEFWEVTNGHARIAENMTEADARLIAAAPWMLAIIEYIYANAAESPEWIRARLDPIINSLAKKA